MGELMSHTAGFTYGVFGNTPVDKLYRAANPLTAPSLPAFIEAVAKLPLAYQPGTRWMYSVGVDIQGYLVEKLSGQTFPEFLRTRLFEPLGMIDTAFFVPAEKMPRVATIYSWNAKAGALAAAAARPRHQSTARACHQAAADSTGPRRITSALRRCCSTAASTTAAAS